MVNQQNFYLLNDSIFKTMFKESEEFREMLNNIFVHFFDFNLKEFNITSEELLISDVEDIKNKVDLLLEVENENYLVNIEINNGNKDYYPNRNLVYVCKIVFSIFKKTSEYRKTFKVVQININDTKCPIDDEIITTTLTLKDNEHNITDERMIIHNLYLGKYKKLPYNELNEIEKDLALLVCKDNNRMKELAKGSKLREKIMSGYRGIVKDEKLLKEIFDPEWDRLCILNSEKSIAREEGHAEGHAEGRAEGRIEGRAEGRIEGIAEGKKEIARSLLKTDMSLEEISKHTNLSIEELEIIKNN